MATIYFDKQEFRNDMRNPYSAARCHAMVRHVIAIRDQMSAMYGALYWQACQKQGERFENPHDYYPGFVGECHSWHKDMTDSQIEKVWDWARSKIEKVYDESMKLSTSVLW